MNETVQQIKSYLSFHPDIYDPDYDVIDLAKESGYSRKLIQYSSKSNDIIPAYLLEPENPNGLAVLIYHQHASQWHLGKSEPAGLAGDPYNHFGPELAKRGYTVLCPDCIGFEDRRRIGSGTVRCHDTDGLQYYNAMTYRIAMGEYLITRILDDYDTALNILINHSFVTNSKLIALGHSFGGNTILFHAALDNRIEHAIVSGSLCTVKTKIENETGLELSLVIPGFYKHFDVDTLLACIAERKVSIISGKNDPYSRDAKEVYDSKRHLWRDKNNMRIFEFEGGHNLDQERFDLILSFFEKR